MSIEPRAEDADPDERTAIGCWRLEVGSGRIEWTDKVKDILGLDDEAAFPTSQLLIDRIDIRDRAGLVAALDDCSRSKQSRSCVLRVRRRDGKTRICRVEMSSQANDAGAVLAILGFFEDITERSSSRPPLRESQRLFRTVVDAVPALIGVKDRSSRYVLVNARFADYHGRPASWFEGRTIAEFYDAPYANLQIEADQRVVRSGQSTGYVEASYLESDGRFTHWLANRMPVKDETGQVEYIIDIGLEVTDLKQAEAARQQSQRLLNAVMDAVPVSLNLKDTEGRYVLVNAYEAAFYGRQPEWFLGKKAADIAPEPYAENVTRRDAEVIESGRALGWIDDSFVDLKGQRSAWLATKLPLLDDSGKVQYVLSIGLDITDRRRAEDDLRASQRLLQAVMDAVPAMVCVKDRRHRCIFVNTAYADYFKQSPGWFVGRRIEELLPPDYVAEKHAVEQRVFGSGRASGFFEETVAEADGRSTAWLANVAPLFDERGQVQHVVSVGLDITERKKAEASLQQSQTLLRTIIDAVPATITVKDTAGNYVLVNAYQANQFGRPAEWFVNRNVADIWPSDYVHQLRQRDDAVIRTRGTQRYYEYDYADSDGRITSWMGIRSPILNEIGAVSYVVSVGLDITELKRAEREVQEGRALLQTVIDAVPAMVSVTDGDGRYVFVNAATARYYGKAADWFPGRALEEIHSAEYAAVLHARNRRLLEGAAPPDMYEEQYVEADGRVSSWLSTDVPLLDASGTPKYVVSVALDITDRRRSEMALRESEQRFRHLVESVGVVPYTWDVANRRFLYVGPQVEAMFGYHSGQWIDHRFWMSVIHPDDLEAVKCHAATFNSEPQDDEFEYRAITADGSTVWVRDVLRIQRAEHGELIGYGMYFDVTASKLRDQQLAQAQKMEAIGKLTGGIAHDFNNLLTVIFGNLDLLEQAAADDPLQADRIRLGKTAARRGAELTRRLLAYARRQVLEPELVDINKRVVQLGELMKRTLGETIGIQMNLTDELWQVRVDPAWFESTVLNLAINARDAMPQGGTLTFETANQWINRNQLGNDADIVPGAYAMLTVRDTGTGMTPEILAQAFDPFFTTKGPGKGTGLGLSMVYGFVKQSGGHIQIQSASGRGTTVRIYLRKAESAAVGVQLGDSEPGRHLNGSETILIVEDDESVRATASAMLDSLGYRVLVAGDGPSALRHLGAEQGISALITDVVLAGGMSGPELAREGMRLVPDVAVLYVSGYAPEPTVLEQSGGAPSEWLGKPYSKLDLARRLRLLLDRRRP